MNKLEACPLCGHNQFRPFRTPVYFRGAKERFSVVRCAKCGFAFTNPRPEGAALAAYYETDDYVSHTESKDSLVNRLYLAVRQWALAQKEKHLEKSLGFRGKLLDFGAGTGAFLQHAEQKGWKVWGTEPDQGARQIAHEKGLDIWAPEDDRLETHRFDVITLWHVLEHLPDLQKDFARLRNMLATKGLLVIAVPNHESWDARLYKDDWAAWDVPLHLSHFRKKDLEKLAQDHGMKVLSIKNMPFDAFYVAMLSEQIRSGKARLPLAFVKGLISNLSSLGRPNMSSLIYTLQRDPS
jgi:2-polyprenyl-3-methyl-5-hydroxy-6-metoxy-1,4-benzoquinol methylase